MSCCTYKCTGGDNCPVREAAHTRAAEKFCAPVYHAPTQSKPPLRIRAWDWPGNLPRKAGKWIDGLNEVAWIGAGVLLIVACAVVAVSCVGR